MSQAAAHEVPNETPLTPESWGKLGMWVFLAGDAMSFGVLLAGYGAFRCADPAWPNPKATLGINLTAAMTFLLICSSLTMVKALEGIKLGDTAKLKRFLFLTILGGAIFLGCQAYEWHHLITHGLPEASRKLGFDATFPASKFATTFFILTGFHGCHVLGGVIYLSCILAASARGAYSARAHNPVEIVGLYWHFVDLVWILVFTFVYLL
jgi:heme/copper-type cytochrome/quinol oxidase subunit 3